MQSILIIQGPTLSIGRTGESLHNKEGGVGKDQIEHFDCTETINWYISTYSNIFRWIIVSTWEGQETDKILRLENVRILKSVDTLRALAKSSKIVGYEGDNKNRQFYTIKAALEIGEVQDCEIAIKVRTDLRVEASKLLEYVRKDPSKLWVPKTNAPTNYFEDFYFGSSVQNIKLLCQSMLNKKPLYKSIHYDAFYKFLKLKFEPNKPSLFDLFPKSDKWTQSQAVAVSKFTRNHMAYFPIEIWNLQVWRGRKILSKNRLSKTSIQPFATTAETVKASSWRHFHVDSLIYYLLGDKTGSAYFKFKGSVQTKIGMIATSVVRIIRKN